MILQYIYNQTNDFVYFDMNILISIIIMILLLFLQILCYRKMRVFAFSLIIMCFSIFIGFESMSLPLPLNPLIPAFFILLNVVIFFFISKEVYIIRKNQKERDY